MTWAHPEHEPDPDRIILHDLYKIHYSWPVNGTVAGHWDPTGGLNYNLTQFKYTRRQDMGGIVFTAGIAVRKHVFVIRVSKSRLMRWSGQVARIEETRHKILVGKPEGKRPLGTRRCRWEDNIRMDLMGTWREGVDWTRLAHESDQCGAVVNTVMNFRVP
jgi:hypothetical protein